jgi:hypothetical protein
MTDVDHEALFKLALEKVGKHNLPLPKKPNFDEAEFEIPEDPDDLTTIELGQRMMQATAFYGYSKRLLGVLDAELVPLDYAYNLRIQQHGNLLRVDPTFKNRSGEIIEAAVLANNDSLAPLLARRLELRSIKVLLEARLEIYDRTYTVLSRELSRREVESRITG